VSIVLPPAVKLSVLTGLSLLAVLTFYSNRVKVLAGVGYYTKLIYFSGSMWFLPLLSTVTFISLVKLGEALVKIFDQG
jgi:hypothetical protein